MAAARNNALPKAGAVNQIKQVLPVQFYAVNYLNDLGVEESTVVLVMADKVYMPPNHLEWTRTLQGGKAWFNKEVLRRIKSSEVPSVDEVPVVP